MAGHTETLTVKLWDHIERNPGLTVDELVDAARRGNMIPPSVRRVYAARLNGANRRRDEGGDAPSPSSRHEPWTVDRAKAEHRMVSETLRGMCRWGSIRRDDGRHFTVRPIKRQGIGAMVQQPEAVRADMLLRQLRIEIGQYIRKHPDGKSYMPKALHSVMRNWYEASRREYLEQQAHAEGGGVEELHP